MADNNLDPELIRKANEGIELTAAQQQKLGTSAAKTAKDTEALGKAAGDASAVLGTFISQIYKGQQGARIFTQTLSGTSQLAGTLGKNGKLAGAAKALAGGLLGLADMSADMSDRLFESFQNLSRVGAAGADGMSGVFDQLQNFRLGLEDLGQLTALFGQNAQSLVLFGGTVEQGAKSLGALRKFVTGSGLEQEFMALGMNTQEINESMAGFVALQSRLGMTQVTDYAKAAQSLDAYIAEQDKITKLTGATRKQQEAAAQKALAIEQFRAKIEQLKAKGDDASRAEANRLVGIFTALEASGMGLEHAFAASTSGFITKGPAVTGALVAGAEIQKVLNDKNIQGAEAVGIIAAGAEKFTSGVGQTLMQVGRFEDVIGTRAGALLDGIEVAKKMSTGALTVEKAALLQRGAKDPATKAQIALRTAQMNTMQNFQSLVEIGVAPATQALAIFAQELHKASILLPGGEPIGGGPIDSSVGAGAAAGARSTDVLPGSGNAATGNPVIDAISGGNAMSGLGIQQRIIGGALGAASSLLRQLGVGSGQEINPDDVINFQSGSGSRQHFDQLQPRVRERALAMAQAYKQATKAKLNLNSAFRSAEEQAALAASGGQGANPIAAPGQSLHQEGRALDFNPTEVDYLEKMGLLKQYGFNRLQGDPPHIFMQDGGIATGPKSGYNAMLHGTEAVVPLPDGKTIPVTMPGMESSMASLAGSSGQSSELREEMSRQSGLIMNQITRLDELVALMRNANGISHKILQASTN